MPLSSSGSGSTILRSLTQGRKDVFNSKGLPLQQRDLRRRQERHVLTDVFSRLNRCDGEGAINMEELFADDLSFASEAECEREDELRPSCWESSTGRYSS